jgi:hypothetical protein
MDITGNFLEIIIGVDQEGFVSSLIKMPHLFIPPIEIRGIRNVEVPHEFLQVAQGGFDEEMKVVLHEDISQDLDLVNLLRLLQDRKERRPVPVAGKNPLPGIPPAGQMIIRIFKLDPQRPRHNSFFYLESILLSRIKI